MLSPAIILSLLTDGEPVGYPVFTYHRSVGNLKIWDMNASGRLISWISAAIKNIYPGEGNLGEGARQLLRSFLLPRSRQPRLSKCASKKGTDGHRDGHEHR
jgi:hypothetical protein